MKIVDEGRQLRVLPEGDVLDTSAFLTWRQRKGDPWLVVENNVVNRIVLGLPPLGFLVQHEPAVTTYDERLEQYQTADVAKGLALGNVLNRNKMGFGKTVETVSMLRDWYARDTVIIAPKSVCPQWKEHYATWWPEMYSSVGVFDLKAPTVVLNYEKLLQTKVITALRSRRHDAVVFDEVHKLKNRKSKRTIAAKEIPARYHVGLTGTPILNKPDDLWSILHAIDWHYSGTNYWNFVYYFCNVVEGHYGKTIEGLSQNPARVAMLHKLLDLVSIYNGHLQVAQGKRRVEVKVDMTKHQFDLYKKIKKLTFEELPENCTIANGAVLAMRLQQTTSWPGLFGVEGHGAKFEWVLDFCEGTDEPVVIFTRFEQTAEALRSYLVDNKISAVTYTGKKKPDVKEAVKQLFIRGETQVIIGTIGAMGEGVDGLQVARLGIMLERDWSPEINEQCEDRLNRRGQESPVTWYYLECAHSFDQHVGKINLGKADAIRLALEAD